MFCAQLQIPFYQQSLLPVSKGWPRNISDCNEGQKHLWASEDLGKHRGERRVILKKAWDFSRFRERAQPVSAKDG